MKVWMNGRILEGAEASVNVLDHGFLYGDGVFEGIRVYDGTVFRLGDHLDRLWKSARALMLAIPLSRQEMTEALLQAVAANGARDAYVRLVVSRGTGDLGLNPASCATATVVIIAGNISIYPAEYYRTGIPLITAASRRLGFGGFDPGIKSLNYLNNILAKMEAKQAGCQEALLLNDAGFIAECTADNFFFARNGTLMTPSADCGLLAGITRKTVIELANKRGIPVTEGRFTRFDAWTADECFMTGTGAEIMPITSIDGRAMKSCPGDLTRTLLADFRALAAGWAE